MIDALRVGDRVPSSRSETLASSWATGTGSRANAVATLLAERLERLDPRLPEPEPGIENLVIT